MKLRPHHILCLQKFTGHGYNEEFTAHMTSIVSELTDNGKTQIIVTQGCDDLCKMCPNNVNNICTSIDKVTLMDNATLNICNLSYGENADWEELARRARERIFRTEEFSNICTCCQWFELCRRTEVYHE